MDTHKINLYINLYRDENGNLVHYYQKFHETLESALEQARDRDGWKYITTISFEAINHGEYGILTESGGKIHS